MRHPISHETDIAHTFSEISDQYRENPVALHLRGMNMLFVGSGIPALAITSQNMFSITDTVIHSEKDTIELIDIQKIIDTSTFIAEILTAL